MGVFSRFRRKSVAASEASTAAAPATTPTADPAADSAVVAAEAGFGETGTATAEPAESAGSETAAAEGVEIPKQQSAEAAADNEAGKSTRK